MKPAVIFDIDGVIRDVGQSYRRALADTVEEFSRRWLSGSKRPSMSEIDQLKQEGIWNNDWEGSRELIYRVAEAEGKSRAEVPMDYPAVTQFFQSRYRGQGTDPSEWDGYITSEPLLVTPAYFSQLSESGIRWGFFSGATRGSAHYVLRRRLQISDPILHAMEDGPEKPDPTGLISVLDQLAAGGDPIRQIVYCGDTTGDMLALQKARQQYPDRQWRAIGILPPHIWSQPNDQQEQFRHHLIQAGADRILQRVTDLDPGYVSALFID